MSEYMSNHMSEYTYFRIYALKCHGGDHSKYFFHEKNLAHTLVWILPTICHPAAYISIVQRWVRNSPMFCTGNPPKQLGWRPEIHMFCNRIPFFSSIHCRTSWWTGLCEADLQHWVPWVKNRNWEHDIDLWVNWHRSEKQGQPRCPWGKFAKKWWMWCSLYHLVSGP